MEINCNQNGGNEMIRDLTHQFIDKIFYFTIDIPRNEGIIISTF